MDELPQLFNILQNNMSFIGPRPLLVEYLERYTNYEKKRHAVKPLREGTEFWRTRFLVVRYFLCFRFQMGPTKRPKKVTSKASKL